MTRIIRLTESDLTRIVRRVINEKQEGPDEIVQGYGKDPYQYKRIFDRDPKYADQWGFNDVRPIYYTARKGTNPKWTKAVDPKVIKEIIRLYFVDEAGAGIDKGPVGIPKFSPNAALKAAAEKFPCLEQQQIKRGGKKIAKDDFCMFYIGTWKYVLENSATKGWYVRRSPYPEISEFSADRVANLSMFYSCKEINFDDKIKYIKK
jgi:hypothetical protein